MFENVLVALDFSPYSQKILNRITQIPGIQEVVLLHVADATRPSRMGWTCGPYIENVKILMAEKKESLENLGMKVHTNVDVIVNEINPRHYFTCDSGNCGNRKRILDRHGCTRTKGTPRIPITSKSGA